ncbi:DUF3987 domain-containing protein [Photobacterium damselae]|uniref:DUF3987 domain-containing protein n=2 Tax=Vibrionaceae TaxID=641 RepID=UPI001F4376F1|nr:DUF3987 domain-containing protein [Photobacterium damselae]UKA09710.1 DUF3987 domain-containing protein [Photobacterium damselae subsp. damselae]
MKEQIMQNDCEDKSNMIKKSKSTSKNSKVGHNIKWNEPEPISGYRVVPEEFLIEMLPSNLWNYISVYSNALNNSPADYLGVSLLVSFASLLGATVSMCPKKNDKSWNVKPTLWGMIVGEPSRYKTPMMNRGMAPLYYAQKEVIDVNNLKNQKKQDVWNEITDKKEADLKKQLSSAIEKGDSKKVEEIEEDLAFLTRLNISNRNVIVNDATPEALYIRLKDNPLGVLQFRDELSGFLVSMNKQGREQERSLFLEGFNASGSTYTQERVGRDKVVLENVHINILGGIQPKMLLPLLYDRLSGRADDGLFERFQLAVWPDDKRAQYTDFSVSEDSQNIVNKLFARVAKLGEKEPCCFNFSEEAQKQWDKWSESFHPSIEKLATEEQAIEIKYPAMVAKIALVLQIAINGERGADTPLTGDLLVDVEALNMAFKWLRYLRSHSKKILSLTQGEGDVSVSSLLANLSKFGGSFTKQQLNQKCWKGLTNRNDRDRALMELENKGYIKLVSEPKKKYLVHPDYR